MPLPQLPFELLYNIIERAWSSPRLTPPDRVLFMRSSKLVSKTWSQIYDDIFSYDIHIPSRSYYYHLFDRMALSPSYGESYLAKCKRLTLTVRGDISASPNGAGPTKSQDPPQNKPRLSLKYMSKFDLEKLPSLQSLNIVYYNAGFPDPCDQGFFVSLPSYLPHLSVSYTFCSTISSSTIDDLRKSFTRHLKVRYAQRKVGTLEIKGGGEYISAIWESLFPDRGKLIRDGKEEKQKLIPVHTDYDETYAINFLLLNLLRARHFMALADAANARYVQEEGAERDAEEESAHVEIGTDEDGLDKEGPLPPAPDVSRSPTERSVEMMVDMNSPTSRLVGRKDRRRKGTLFEDGDTLRLWENEAQQGVKFISNISPDKTKTNALTFPSCVSLGEVGYINSAGAFSPLFNALEPHYVQGGMIPSLHGYSQYDMPDSSANSAGIIQTKNTSKNKFMGAFRKVWKSKTSTKKSGKMRYVEETVAETWFKANVDRVVEDYTKEIGEMIVRKDNLVLVVGCSTISG